MKYKSLCLAIILILAVTGCSEQGKGLDNSVTSAAVEDVPLEIKLTVDEVVSMFEENECSVIYESAEQQLLTGKRYLLTVDGASNGRITLYEYDNSAQVQADIACIDESGSKIVLANGIGSETTHIEWKSVPHFYHLNNMIVQYVGTDESMLSLLTNLCGEQFAGGDTE